MIDWYSGGIRVEFPNHLFCAFYCSLAVSHLCALAHRGSCFYQASLGLLVAPHPPSLCVYICVFGWPEGVMKRSFSLQGLLWSEKADAEEEEDKDDKKHLCFFVSLFVFMD